MTHTKKFAKLAALAAIPLLLAGLAGCTSSADADAQSAAKNSASSGSTGGVQAQGEYEDWYLGFAKCMREKGVDIPDTPEPSMSISADDGYVEASESCIKEVGAAPGQDAGDDSATNDAQRVTAKCFRENGFDVPDPKPGQAGMVPDAPQDVIEKCLAASGR